MDPTTLKKITKEFNKYRFPECKAKVILNTDNLLIVEFSGTKASFACCFDENFFDYHYYIKDFAKEDFQIMYVDRISNDRFIVIYKRNKDEKTNS